MCGIFGYAGEKDGVPFVIEGLKKLEYRGYDSAGAAALGAGGLGVRRSVGKLSALRDLLELNPLPGSPAIGHTRWATHGVPSEANAHPHADCGAQLAVVHNGIIENYASLKTVLEAEGHVFRSQTDTEVLAHLVERRLKAGGDLKAAVLAVTKEVHGAYALAVIWAKEPGRVVAARMSSPLVVGLGEGETYLASDVPAFLKHTRRAVFLEDGELAVLEKSGARFFSSTGLEVEKPAIHVQWDSGTAEKGGYKHFMLKEIHEQPRSIENTLRGRLLPLNDGILERETGLPKAALRDVKQIHILACGTAYHAGLIGKYLLERYAGIPTQVETASEYRYRKPLIPPGTLAIAVSQSGETADTIAAVKLAREAGAKVLSVCNTLGASLTRVSDFNFHTRCGPECGVASTKAFTGQLVGMTLLALHMGQANGKMSEAEGEAWVRELKRLPELITAALKLEDRVRTAAELFAKASSCLFIGRTLNYPTAIEGALKLKEISYIHAEGYPAGEMKHGPLALVDKDLPVVAIATESDVFEKVASNVEEARARGGRIIALVTEGETRLDGKCEVKLEVPPTLEFLSPAVNIVPLQLLSYYAALARGCDVDQPRNLAKSVTVE